MANDFSIRKLTPDDWQIFSNMRLRALKECPGVFLSKYEESKNRTKEQWQETLGGGDKQVFGIFDGQNLIGISGIFTSEMDPSGESGMMGMSYIVPEYRGRRLSNFFYKFRIDWALNYPSFKKLTIGHREGNEPSRNAMLAHGFKYVGKELIDWPDGSRDFEHMYELDLENLRK